MTFSRYEKSSSIVPQRLHFLKLYFFTSFLFICLFVYIYVVLYLYTKANFANFASL